MNWETIIVAIISAAFLPLITWGLSILKNFVEAKIAAMDDQLLSNMLYDAYNTVQKVVLYVMQTYVDSLKAKGEFDAMAQEEAFKMAQKRATQMINDTAKELINARYGNFAVWLDTQIEKTVRENKK